MATKYLALLTNIGAAKLAKATALGTKVEITQLAVGDGNGVLPTPNPAQTALVHELRRAPLNMLTVDPANASQIIAEQVIPEDVGGWWIREIGLFDKDGDMVAIANCAETYKPQLQEGSGRVQVIRVILIVSSTEAVTLKIDPAVVLATRQYVHSQLRAHEQSRNHPDASTTEKGLVQLSSSVTSDSESQAATSKAVKIAMDNGSARLAKDRNLSDLPNTALARQNLELGDSSTRNVGTTAGTVASGDDARITGAMQKSQNGGDIPDVAKFLQNLGLGEGSALPVGVPVPWSSATPPTGWLKCNGAAFTAEQYPKLALAYPALKLPDLRGEFIRGWDDGRGVDSGRSLLSAQSDAIRNITGKFGNAQLFPSIYRDGAFGGVLDNISQTNGLTMSPPGQGNGVVNFSFDASKVVPVASENRPRSIAFNYIVRAA
ncbi:phage tail protein [Enterobacter vonholyi]|uniref:phage tail-collar fiber domain-containing protein n=1 Tax=Enterobacter vonholyi TaxID=2797505 RepID=UPI0032B4ADE2